MKIDTFLTCLGYFGVSTGASSSLEGVYSLASGYSGIFFNQIYSSGAHFVNGQIYGPTLPLVNVYNNIINNNTLSGHNGLRVGYVHSGNFGLVMDIEYSGCNRSVQGRGMVLVSTASSPSGLNSGFVVGISDANTLYFETSGYRSTLDKELNTRNFVYTSLHEQQYVTFGIFDLDNNVLYSQNVNIERSGLLSSDLYLGNFLYANNSDPYTGFVGKINQAVLFKSALTDYDVGVCANCSLTTGLVQTGQFYSIVMPILTGWALSGIVANTVTGYRNVTGSILTHDASTLNVVFPSGQTGLTTTGQYIIPTFSGLTTQGWRDSYVFAYDNVALDSFAKFTINFHQVLTSGDVVEVYTYPQTNPNIGKRLNGLVWPIATGVIQLIANGLNETFGVDYSVYHNQISGETLDDVLFYDLLTTPSVVTSYSGYWTGESRMLMSGSGYFPPAPQYLENTTNFSGIIKITGLSGICRNNPFYPRFGYDLHMNGQKLISGMHYDIVTSGTSGFVVSLSGKNLPQLLFYPVYNAGFAYPTGMESVDDSELTFIPQFSGFRRSRYDVTGDTTILGPVTGFGEQVWVNGIRQLDTLDYQKVFPCSIITGSFTPPVLDFMMYDSYGNSNGMWNLVPPPAIYDVVNTWSNTQDPITFEVGFHVTVPSPYPHGSYVEVFASRDWGPFVFWDVTDTDNQYFEYTHAGVGKYCYRFLLRYRYGNYVGPSVISNEACSSM